MLDVAKPVSDACPECSGRGRVVTAVTVRTLGDNPRRVLVTRQCESERCLFKYPILKSETELSDEERAVWHQP